MHCRVRAGPATRMPGVRATGPRIRALRMPSLDNSPLTVALPIPDSLDTSAGSGRWMSGVSTMVWLFLYSLAIRRRRLLENGETGHGVRPYGVHVGFHPDSRGVGKSDVAVL